jgi:hypothetical protein
MSVRIMGEIWEHGPRKITERFVLLAIADNANDAGLAFPSIKTLATKCVMSPRTIMRIIANLEFQGVVTVVRRPGCGSEYQITDKAVLHIDTSDNLSPVTKLVTTPVTTAERKKESNKERKKSSKPSINHHSEFFLTGIPDWVPVDSWRAFVEMRRKIHKPLTDHAVKLAFRKLEMLRDSGQDPQAVLEQSILYDYQGLFPVREEKRNGSSKEGLIDAIRNSRGRPDFGRSPVPDDVKLGD